MNKFKVIHDHEGCIGCGACAAVAEEYWEMIGDKAHLKESKMIDGNEVRILDKDFEMNEEAMQVCPVEVIHIKEMKKETLKKETLVNINIKE